MNRNACQLSQELKFVSNQIGSLGRFIVKRFNDIGSFINELRIRQVQSNVPEQPQCNWLEIFKVIFWIQKSHLLLLISLDHIGMQLNSPWHNVLLVVFTVHTSLLALKTKPALMNLVIDLVFTFFCHHGCFVAHLFIWSCFLIWYYGCLFCFGTLI